MTESGISSASNVHRTHWQHRAIVRQLEDRDVSLTSNHVSVLKISKSAIKILDKEDANEKDISVLKISKSAIKY